METDFGIYWTKLAAGGEGQIGGNGRFDKQNGVDSMGTPPHVRREVWKESLGFSK